MRLKGKTTKFSSTNHFQLLFLYIVFNVTLLLDNLWDQMVIWNFLLCTHAHQFFQHFLVKS